MRHSGEPSGDRLVALIRGVNVGGRSLISMTRLQDVVTDLGVANVSTYIQSGNVLFSAPSAGRPALARRLAEALADDLGRPPVVLIKTRRELMDAAAGNPFDPRRDDANLVSHIMFLAAVPSAGRCQDLLDRQGHDYRFSISDDLVYVAYPRATVGSRRSVDIERVLGVSGTMRTYKVVDALVRLAESTPGKR